ncbi:MAG: hypothetical protein HKN15_11845 [Xanthomonadales bacterium]|nr:hypothetical protein [Xanthomonadales bacterium]
MSENERRYSPQITQITQIKNENGLFVIRNYALFSTAKAISLKLESVVGLLRFSLPGSSKGAGVATNLSL